MAAPIQLKSNTPGKNSYSKSRSAQKTKDGSVNKMGAVAARPQRAKRSADSAVGKATTSQAEMRVKAIAKGVADYTSSWMQAHGMHSAQKQVPRTPYANVPADLIGAGTGTRTSVKKSVASSAKVNPSGKTTTKRVKSTFTGKSFKNAKHIKVIKAK